VTRLVVLIAGAMLGVSSADAAVSPFGVLHVHHVTDPKAPIPAEGSVWHVWLTNAFAGHPVDPGRPVDARLISNDIRVRLAKGRYVLHSEELPCDGNCGFLDPPRDRCARPITIKGGRTLNARVTLAARGGCTITVAPGG
jgi:hypothetical protein